MQKGCKFNQFWVIPCSCTCHICFTTQQLYMPWNVCSLQCEPNHQRYLEPQQL